MNMHTTSLEERNARPLTIALICWLLMIFSAMYSWQKPDAVMISEAPDAWMHLFEAKELLHNWDWYDHRVERSNTPHGIDYTYTRTMDMLLIAGAAPFLLFMDSDTALLASAILFNPVLGIIAICLITAILRQRGQIPFDAFFVAFAFVTTWSAAYFAVGRCDHHSLLVTLSIALLYLGSTITFKKALYAGLIVGFGIWSSVEFQIPALLFGIWLGGWWLITGERKWLQYCSATLTATAAMLLLAIMSEQPPADRWMIEYDSVSIVHLASFGILALATHILLLLPSLRLQTMLTRFTFGLFTFTPLLAILWLMFPLIHKGNMGGASPEMLELFLRSSSEMQPLFTNAISNVISALLFPLVGILLSLRSWNREQDQRQTLSLMLLFCLAFTVLTLFYSRQMYYLTAPGIILIGFALIRLSERLTDMSALRIGIILAACAPIIPISFANMATKLGMFHHQSDMAESETQANKVSGDVCSKTLKRMIQSGEITSVLGNAPLATATPSNVGSYMLFYTPYSIIAYNYHRNLGLLEQATLYDGTDSDKIREIIQERQLDVIFYCDTNHRFAHFAEEVHPEWFSPVEELTKPDMGIRVYRVHQNKTAN